VVGPDLEVVSMSAPSTALVGATIDVDYRVENGGDEDVGRFVNRLWWSANAQRDGADTALCDDTVNRLTAAGAADRTFTCTLPGNLSGGGYLIVEADADTDTSDTSRANNTRTSTFTITAPTQPDLKVSSLSVTGPVEPGDDVDVRYTVRNAGSVTAAASNTKVWLSTDELVDRRDTLLCSDGVGALAAAAGSARTLSACTVPAATTDGDWQVLVQLDADGAVNEGDELNNVLSADLRVESAVVIVSDRETGSWDTATDPAVVSDPPTDPGAEPTDPTTEVVTDGASDTGVAPRVIPGPRVPLGCGCRAAEGPAGFTPLALGLLLARRRRRA